MHRSPRGGYRGILLVMTPQKSHERIKLEEDMT
jgi:hypothetical protein